MNPIQQALQVKKPSYFYMVGGKNDVLSTHTLNENMSFFSCTTDYFIGNKKAILKRLYDDNDRVLLVSVDSEKMQCDMLGVYGLLLNIHDMAAGSLLNSLVIFNFSLDRPNLPASWFTALSNGELKDDY